MRAVTVLKCSFVLIGVVMLAVANFTFFNTKKFLNNAVATEGTVIELVRKSSSKSRKSKTSTGSSRSTTYKPVVEFKTKDGQLVEFTSLSGSNPPSYSRGETVKVLYQENTPERARIDGFFSLWGLPVIFGVIGSMFFFIGLSIILKGRKKNQNDPDLRWTGRPVQAKFQSVDFNKSFKVNRRYPYQIRAQWLNPTTSEIHIFDSENIGFDPADYINQEIITVFIEEGNPKNYYVDISFLPKLAR